MWVWGDDDNEKMTGLSRQKGDSGGGGSHGDEGAPQAGKAFWEHQHVRGSTNM